MGDDGPPDLNQLGARIEAARRSRQEPEARRNRGLAGAELAWRMVIDLTVGIGIGFGMGWGLDGLFGTEPVFIILMTMAGLAAGVKVMLRSAREHFGQDAGADSNGDGR
ncbi:MAG: ATP synthase protein I [Paracoccaceae bacterium]|nr:MAG: AtpZ/AtpI family protein [Alphaproteobacteria bacterium]GIX14945.1 MAG: ATP synthase protein I [Paracoccaceae bacterium]